MITEEEIKEINSKCPIDQGIFIEPYGIPINIKEPVVYRRFKVSGVRGGSCWGTEHYNVEFDEENEDWAALDLLLELLIPNISYLQYKKINKLIRNNRDTENDYYGNSTDYKVEYIILSELQEFIDNLI